MFLDCIPKKQLILVIFYLFMVVFGAPTGQPGAPFIFKACILVYNNIFFIKVLKNWMCLDCIPKKQLIFVVFQLFLVIFWAPTGQPGAPFILKACILVYNNIFFIKVLKNQMFLDCIPKKQLILVVFQLFSVVFWAPTGQPEAPFLFKACILAYNNIFFIKVPRIRCYFTAYPKNSSFLLIFSYFWQFFGPLQPSLGPPSYSKHVFQHTIIFSLLKFPRIGCFLTVYPKNRSFLSCFDYFWQFFL